ncbi:Hsp33 family molecular chaperone HslO [Allopusillimonas soli]|uniref:Hsp33 family molecular chaperone HslO n=1 Tax=Allopusillimonas soli TaxID=659016 RepID=A0A853F9M2_9BURK|nr:Hsp33 family molecular chaperone HslO [Allopusillimonas soli]NYT35630.1 Hsp33 family molecular chaperone HslO [Allopusillimonas soli]TEA76028.1 Hsp33 family molecular chaperone HslO [Allopusillimonas soli]
MSDLFKKYLVQDHSTRIQAVRLTEAWQTGLAHQHFPSCVQSLLGELASAAVLLASNIKFDGTLVLQLQGGGPVALIVVECTSALTIRATATLREGKTVPEHGTLQTLLNADGQGRFSVVLDPGKKAGMAPYQGIIPLQGDTVALVLEDYMRNSEQLDTRLWLAADAQHSAGLLLQRLPDHGGHAQQTAGAETWNRLKQLAATLKHDELLALDSDEVIHRLFWQEALEPFEPQAVRWYCPCTRERVAGMLRTLGQQEIQEILAQEGNVEIVCNFCGKPYHFDAVDCAGLFVEKPGPHASDSSLH